MTHRRIRRHRRGATMILIAILLPVLFGLSAYAINIAYIEAVNTDIQITVDAAARAAGRAYISTNSKSDALSAAQQASRLNPVAGQTINFDAGDLEYGISERTDLAKPYSFDAVGHGNAVRVTTNSLSIGSGQPIAHLFPFFGSAFQIRPRRTAVNTQATLDIGLVLDRSGSMAYAATEDGSALTMPASAPAGWNFDGPVPPNSRWLDTVAAVNTFNQFLIDSPQQERLSLSTYNTETATNMLLTEDYSQIKPALNAISSYFIVGGTNIGGGIYEGLAAVTDPSRSRPYATKVLVLMTDGIHNYGSDPRWAANYAGQQGVTVFTVTFSDEADQYAMADVAHRAGGKHFHAQNAAQLQEAFREIARSLPSLLTR